MCFSLKKVKKSHKNSCLSLPINCHRVKYTIFVCTWPRGIFLSLCDHWPGSLTYHVHVLLDVDLCSTPEIISSPHQDLLLLFPFASAGNPGAKLVAASTRHQSNASPFHRVLETVAITYIFKTQCLRPMQPPWTVCCQLSTSSTTSSRDVV